MPIRVIRGKHAQRTIRCRESRADKSIVNHAPKRTAARGRRPMLTRDSSDGSPILQGRPYARSMPGQNRTAARWPAVLKTVGELCIVIGFRRLDQSNFVNFQRSFGRDRQDSGRKRPIFRICGGPRLVLRSKRRVSDTSTATGLLRGQKHFGSRRTRRINRAALQSAIARSPAIPG